MATRLLRSMMWTYRSYFNTEQSIRYFPLIMAQFNGLADAFEPPPGLPLISSPTLSTERISTPLTQINPHEFGLGLTPPQIQLPHIVCDGPLQQEPTLIAGLKTAWNPLAWTQFIQRASSTLIDHKDGSLSSLDIVQAAEQDNALFMELSEDTDPFSLQLSIPREPTCAEPSTRLPQNVILRWDLRCSDHGCNGRRFSSIENYKRHIREKSLGHRVTCFFCHMSFTRKSNLKQHLSLSRCKASCTTLMDNALLNHTL